MKPSNPPAFPCGTAITDNGHIARDGDDGMSLRDYFAAVALTGICASEYVSKSDAQHKHIAEIAFSVADAMLREREKSLLEGEVGE